MKAISGEGVDAKRNFSKIDQSGTDPNRYASVSNTHEAELYTAQKQRPKTKSIIPGVKGNVSVFERFLTAAAGTYLLYNGFSGKHKSATQMAAGGALLARAISGYCPVYDVAGKRLKFEGSNVNIRTSLIIGRPVEQVYNFWRRLENLPRFMNHLKSVEEIDNITSEWTAKGPAGIGTITWKAQILMDEPSKVLSWHSMPGSTIDNAGKVSFRKLDESTTEIEVVISYHAPLGFAGEAAAKLLNPVFEKIVKSDIESLKSYLEEGRGLSD